MKTAELRVTTTYFNEEGELVKGEYTTEVPLPDEGVAFIPTFFPAPGHESDLESKPVIKLAQPSKK